MSVYRTVVVGTDGSETSLEAVAKAGRIAADNTARLVIVCAFFPLDSRAAANAADQLGSEGYQVQGDNPAEEILRTARERAEAAGAVDIDARPVVGSPVDVLLSTIEDLDADLLVIGNRGMNSLTGRLLGSVPSDVARRAACDVLIVHTTG